MKCPKCGAEMAMLFVSMYCPRCESSQSEDNASTGVGYIVWRQRPPGSCEYVFKSEADALRWRTAAGLDRFPIREVLSKNGFTWRPSTGSVRDIYLADRLFEIFHEETSGSNQAYLGPEPA